MNSIEQLQQQIIKLEIDVSKLGNNPKIEGQIKILIEKDIECLYNEIKKLCNTQNKNDTSDKEFQVLQGRILQIQNNFNTILNILKEKQLTEEKISEESIIEKAANFALLAHKGQKRKGSGLPYIMHPMAVANYIRMYILAPVGKLSIEELIVCAYLHDTVEDCNVTLETISHEFGLNIASVVKELTNDKDAILLVGKEKYMIEKFLTISNDALAVKLCDRLDNLIDSNGPYFSDEKKKEICMTNIRIFAQFNQRVIPDSLISIKKIIFDVLKKY